MSAEKEENKRKNQAEVLEVQKPLLQMYVLDKENTNLEQSLHQRKQGIYADNEQHLMKQMHKNKSHLIFFI